MKKLLVVLVVVALLFGVTPAFAQDDQPSGCTVLVGDKVVEVPSGTLNDASGLVCENGAWVPPTTAVQPAVAAPAETVGVMIDKLNTFDQSASGLWTAEVGGEREQMVEAYNQLGQPTVVYLISSLQEDETAARWQIYGSRWEMTQFGVDSKFDMFKNAVTYIVDRHSRGENVSGLIIDMHEGGAIVANLFELTQTQVENLLDVQASTMSDEAAQLVRNATWDIRVTLDVNGNPVYVEEVLSSEVTCVVTRPAGSGEANLRSEPSLTAVTPAQMLPGSTLNAVARSADSAWWQVDLGTQLLWVSADVVDEIGSCQNLPVVGEPALTAPQAQPAQSATVCLPAERQGDVDNLATVGDGQNSYVIEAWEGVGITTESFIVVPKGETLTNAGYKGALWKYQGCTGNKALADIAGRGKPVFVVTAGQLVQQ